MSPQSAPIPLTDPKVQTRDAHPRVWPSWVALALAPVVLLAVDLVVEPQMTAGRLSMDAGNTLGFVIVFAPLVTAIVLAARSVRAGVQAARWPMGVAIGLTAAWGALCVLYVLS